MKHFLVGDGHKRISCPDQYLADSESEDTTVIWNPDDSETPIRVTILTITPKDPECTDLAYWSVIDKAREQGIQPVAEDKKVHFSYRSESDEPDTIMHYSEIGIGNHLCFFSIAVSPAVESSSAFARMQADAKEMIRSLAVRDDEEQFTGELLESQREQIAEASKELLGSKSGESAWEEAQANLDRAYADGNEDLARSVGLAFGELLRSDLPSLTWAVKSDEYGTSLSLDLAGTSISVFPEDMILKRFECKEALNLRKFADETLETLDEIFRENQP